ncbi:MAG: hypothetical protein GY841_20820, partial [FCB group bacterium]|nr:hypothetical protein [FCB group bacterium]
VLARFYRSVREEWRSDEFPALFLFLDLLAEEIDVNVHPRKAEVRFRSLAFVDRVEEALRATLVLARGEEQAPLASPLAPPRMPAAWDGLGGKHAAQTPRPEWEPPPAAPEAAEGPEAGPPAAEAGRIAQAAYAPIEPRPVALSGRSGERRPFRLLGQYKGSLILLEGHDGLYLIDQHVAHERLLYERLRRSMAAERAASQTLLTPPILELAPAEAMRLRELAPGLDPCGFVLAPLSGNSIAVTAIPTMLSIAEA